MLLLRIEVATVEIVIISCHLQHLIGNEVLTCAVAFNNGMYQILRHVCIVCQQLLRVFRQAVTAVAEARIVIVCADSRVKAYTLNDGLSVKSFNFCVCVKFIEIAYTQSQICVGKNALQPLPL